MIDCQSLNSGGWILEFTLNIGHFHKPMRHRSEHRRGWIDPGAIRHLGFLFEQYKGSRIQQYHPISDERRLSFETGRQGLPAIFDSFSSSNKIRMNPKKLVHLNMEASWLISNCSPTSLQSEAPCYSRSICPKTRDTVIDNRSQTCYNNINWPPINHK